VGQQWETCSSKKEPGKKNQEVVDVYHEGVVYTIHCAPSKRRLFLAPTAIQRLRHIVSKVPIPGTRTLSAAPANCEKLSIWCCKVSHQWSDAEGLEGTHLWYSATL
jgi:hypothetical protein